MKTVTLLGQSYNDGVADAGVTTVATCTVQVADTLTYFEFLKTEAYLTAAQELQRHPGGVDYVAVMNDVSWPTYSIASSSMNDAGELHA